MIDLSWSGSVAAGAICYGAGMMAWYKAPKSPPAGFFLFAMSAVFVASMTGPLYPMLDQANSDAGNAIAKVFVSAALLAFALLLCTSFVFPKARALRLRPPNALGWCVVATIVAMAVLGSTTRVDYSDPDAPMIARDAQVILAGAGAASLALTTALVLVSMRGADAVRKSAARLFLAGLWVFGVCAIAWALLQSGVLRTGDELVGVSHVPVVIGLGLAGLLFAYSIGTGHLSMEVPAPESLASKAKAKYKLLARRAYLVEEPKPDLAFKMFTEILKARCWDCQNDDSFPCESLDCPSCTLPCPCKACDKYKSRPQGLVVTRQFPNEVRKKHYLQTTPVIWLSTVSGADNLDPAKLSVLTDRLVNFMERSQNGVILVDGIEYLVTSNDFQRVLKSVDRWTEVAMTTNSRLIISIDPRAFSQRELAMLERDREIVRPEAVEESEIIPEQI